MADLPAEWRERMVDMIRGAAPLDGAWFTGGPWVDGEGQIGIYRTQYGLRLYEALSIEVPGVKALLGDEAEPLLRRYLDENPSRTWTLNRVADGLASWLQRQPGSRPEVVDMARLDHAIQLGFEAADGVPLDPASLATMPPLRLQPHVHLLRLRAPVHEWRAKVLAGEPGPALSRGDYPLIVFRRGIGMRTWPAPLGLWSILEGISRGRPVPAAIDEAFLAGHATIEELSEEIGGWFRDLAERGIVSVRP